MAIQHLTQVTYMYFLQKVYFQQLEASENYVQHGGPLKAVSCSHATHLLKPCVILSPEGNNQPFQTHNQEVNK